MTTQTTSRKSRKSAPKTNAVAQAQVVAELAQLSTDELATAHAITAYAANSTRDPFVLIELAGSMNQIDAALVAVAPETPAIAGPNGLSCPCSEEQDGEGAEPVPGLLPAPSCDAVCPECGRSEGWVFSRSKASWRCLQCGHGEKTVKAKRASAPREPGQKRELVAVGELGKSGRPIKICPACNKHRTINRVCKPCRKAENVAKYGQETRPANWKEATRTGAQQPAA